MISVGNDIKKDMQDEILELKNKHRVAVEVADAKRLQLEKEIQDTLLKNELRKDVDRYYGIVYAINRYLYNLAQADVSTYISTINFTRSSRETLTPSQAKQAAQELEELRISWQFFYNKKKFLKKIVFLFLKI